jgi:hypothetical protein
MRYVAEGLGEGPQVLLRWFESTRNNYTREKKETRFESVAKVLRRFQRLIFEQSSSYKLWKSEINVFDMFFNLGQVRYRTRTRRKSKIAIE